MHKINHLLDLWEQRFEGMIADGKRSPTSLDTYRRSLKNHIRPAIGELRIGEATTPRIDTVLTKIKTNAGAPTAKTCRAIISGAMKLAARYGAISVNPVREVDAIEAPTKNPPRALSREEVTLLRKSLAADERAVDADLPDLTTFMLGTGVRIGEALAVLWHQIDLEAGTVHITHTIARPPGEGLIRKPTKSRTGERLLTLRTWATTSLRARHSAGWLALVVGFAASIPTSASGLADFLTLGRRHPARPAVVRHLLPALSTLPCFGAAIVLGHPSYHEGDIAPVPLILTIAGFVGLTAAGDAGGRLVFTQGLRVKNR